MRIIRSRDSADCMESIQQQFLTSHEGIFGKNISATTYVGYISDLSHWCFQKPKSKGNDKAVDRNF